MNGTVSENKSQKTVTPVTVLVLGIVAAALSYSGYSVAGIILGCIAAKKVKTYLKENNGVTCTMVMCGSILSKVGIYLGIALTVIYALYLVYIIIFYFVYIGMVLSLITQGLFGFIHDFAVFPF